MTLPFRLITACLLMMAIIAGTGCGTTRETSRTKQTGPHIRTDLQQRLTYRRYNDAITVQGERLVAINLLRQFYRQRSYQPAWSRNLKPTKQAKKFIEALGQAKTHGLTPATYHHHTVTSLLRTLPKRRPAVSPRLTEDLVAFDLLLTDAYFLYASHLSGTRVSRKMERPVWQRNSKQVDLMTHFKKGLTKKKIAQHLEKLITKESGYIGLAKALSGYKTIAAQGGWPYIPPGPVLQTGASGERVALLRRRLAITGDLSKAKGSDILDDELAAAVSRFQDRHGLLVDGIVARRTLMALNIPIERRIRQIEANMARRRWLPDELGQRYIVVNIPAYQLQMLEHKNPVLTMNVVVGRKHEDWQTPALNSRVTYMIINPKWNVPESIFEKELLKKIQEDPNYLADHNMKLVPIGGRSKKAIDPSTIDWSQVTGKEGTMRIVQDAGNGNSLGRIKFMFSNPFAIYMHDTQSRSLFRRHRRAFSHGCVRVHKPLEMAEHLLNDKTQWSRRQIVAAIDEGENRAIYLKEPVNLYVQYWTAWTDRSGTIQFRDDIYDRDNQPNSTLGI